MGFLLKITTVLALIVGVPIIHLAFTFAITEVYGREQLCYHCDYTPPDQGGPDITQGSGTR